MTAKKKMSYSSEETVLSKTDLFYIEQNFSSMSIDDLAKDIGVSTDAIQERYDSFVAKKKADALRTDNLMKIDSKRGYTVMTREASEKNEAQRKRGSIGDNKHIHKIRQG